MQGRLTEWHRSWHLVLPLCVLVLSPTISVGQRQGQTVFRARSVLVRVPVAVKDSAGSHVSGLGKEMFSILDDGEPRNIESFDEIVTDRSPLPPMTPDIVRNLSYGGDVHRPVTVILLDLLNTSFADQSYAREQLLRQLTGMPVSSNPTGLFLLTSAGLTIVHDFTSDPRNLAAALQHVKLTPGQHLLPPDGHTNIDGLNGTDPVAVLQVATRLLDGIGQPFRSLADAARLRNTANAFQQIGRALQRVPAPKSVVWITGDVPTLSAMSPVESYVDLGAAMDALVVEGLTIHVVDARGLIAFTPSQMPLSPLAERLGQRRSPPDYVTYTSVSMSIDRMRTLARRTGGLAFVNRNDLSDCVQEALDQFSSYYLLTFYAPKTKVGKWHNISVKFHGKNAHVKARDGYFNLAPDEPQKELPSALRQPDTMLWDRAGDVEWKSAILSPLDATALPLALRWTAKAGGSLSFELTLPVLLNDSGQLDLDIHVLEMKSAGARELSVQRASGKPNQIRGSTFVLYSSLRLEAGEHRIRVAVRDHATGAIGTVTSDILVTPGS